MYLSNRYCNTYNLWCICFILSASAKHKILHHALYGIGYTVFLAIVHHLPYIDLILSYKNYPIPSNCSENTNMYQPKVYKSLKAHKQTKA